MEQTYTISRYEEQGDSLFICINSTNNPVYHEHFFTTEEKLDIPRTIERLVAELELKDEAYVAPLPRVSKVEEAKALTIDKTNIATKKAKIVADKLEAIAIEEAEKLAKEELQAIEDAKVIEPIIEEVAPIEEVIK